ncbi:MAG: hypothetical protein ACOYO1_18555 [Bacteroidales bacterium]
MNHIINWMMLLGNEIGALGFYFRNEAETADTSALPPHGIDREPTYVEYNDITGKDENTSNDLRLYCLRANNRVVFLFNGDIKTTNNAKDCPNVRSHFKLANTLTKAIDEAFIAKDIQWNHDQTDIIFENNFELNF